MLGQSTYPTHEFMRASEDGNRIHPMKDWLHQAILKGYFGKKRADLLTHRANLIASNVKQAHAAKDRQAVVELEAARSSDN